MSNINQVIIRIDKADGSESIEANDQRVRETIKACYPGRDFDEVLEQFYWGMPVLGVFANYELHTEVK